MKLLGLYLRLIQGLILLSLKGGIALVSLGIRYLNRPTPNPQPKPVAQAMPIQPQPPKQPQGALEGNPRLFSLPNITPKHLHHTLWDDPEWRAWQLAKRAALLDKKDGKFYVAHSYFSYPRRENYDIHSPLPDEPLPGFVLAPLADPDFIPGIEPVSLPPPDGKIWIATASAIFPMSSVPTPAPE